MISAATRLRRVGRAKIALARSYGASTCRSSVRADGAADDPRGLMIGSIFGLLTAVGTEMVGGGFGLGNR